MRMTPRVIVKKLIRRWIISSSARCCDRHALLMISWFTTMSQKNVSDNGSDWCSDTTRRDFTIVMIRHFFQFYRVITHQIYIIYRISIESMREINYGDAKKSTVLFLFQLLLVINNKNATWSTIHNLLSL